MWTSVTRHQFLKAACSHRARFGCLRVCVCLKRSIVTRRMFPQWPTKLETESLAYSWHLSTVLERAERSSSGHFPWSFAADWALVTESVWCAISFCRHLLSCGNYQGTETCMVLAFPTPQKPLQNHPSGYLGGHVPCHESLSKTILQGTLEGMGDTGIGCTTSMILASEEKATTPQHHRVDIPANARTAHNGLLQEILEEDLCWIVPYVSPTTQSVKGLIWTELNCHRNTDSIKANRQIKPPAPFTGWIFLWHRNGASVKTNHAVNVSKIVITERLHIQTKDVYCFQPFTRLKCTYSLFRKERETETEIVTDRETDRDNSRAPFFQTANLVCLLSASCWRGLVAVLQYDRSVWSDPCYKSTVI